MQTHISPLTPQVFMPAPPQRSPDGELRTVTVSLPRELEFSETVDDVAVYGELRLSAENRYELVKLELQADSIGPDELRNIPVRSLIVTAARRHAEGVIRTDLRITTKAFNRSELADDELVAGLWQLARACRDNPNPLIAAELGISPAAAAQRVARLRRAGVIPKVDKQGRRY